MRIDFVRKYLGYLVGYLMAAGLLLSAPAAAAVLELDGRTYLVDRTGERWEITQARSLGFDPWQFEFGIGRFAFRPLDEDDFTGPAAGGRTRVIGVAADGHAHAYAVSRLAAHETANTYLGETPIVAGY